MVGRTDFDGLLIDERQLLRILDAPPMTAAISKEDAAKELSVEVKILENIMRIPDEVAKPDFEQFQYDHISIRGLAETEGAALAEIHAARQRRGLSPILSNMPVATQIFRRSDI